MIRFHHGYQILSIFVNLPKTAVKKSIMNTIKLPIKFIILDITQIMIVWKFQNFRSWILGKLSICFDSTIMHLIFSTYRKSRNSFNEWKNILSSCYVLFLILNFHSPMIMNHNNTSSRLWEKITRAVNKIFRIFLSCWLPAFFIRWMKTFHKQLDLLTLTCSFDNE